MPILIQIFLMVLGPWVILIAIKKLNLASWMSPVVLCYLLGILIISFKLFPLDDELAKSVSEGSILIAIPLLLFSANLKQWFKQAKHTALSFGLCIVAGSISTVTLAYVFQDFLPDIWQPAAMLAGVYTGGTPNMQAIGLALEVPQETFVLLNAADLLWSGVYLIFLTSIGKKVVALFLPQYKSQSLVNHHSANNKEIIRIKDIAITISFAIGIVGLSLGLTWLIFSQLAPVAFIMLCLTTGALIASFFPNIQRRAGSFEAGEYLLLVFCVAIGMRSDFGQLVEQGGMSILFTGAVVTLAISLHYFLSWVFKIDRDTTMITSTAAIFGPAFVGQIASVLNNREIVVAGVATGLVGYAVGNYLGIGIGYFLKYLLTT